MQVSGEVLHGSAYFPELEPAGTKLAHAHELRRRRRRKHAAHVLAGHHGGHAIDTAFRNRSFTINDEANLNVYDAAFAQGQAAIFAHDLQQSRQISYKEWKARPWQDKVLDWAVSLLGSQL